NRNEQSDIHNEDDQHEKESHLDVVNVFNANTDADFLDTSLKFDNYDKNTNTSNVDRTLFMEHSAKADQITNSSCLVFRNDKPAIKMYGHKFICCMTFIGTSQ
ncbi:unnamed protein product, partial [Ceratitis capitata]